MDMSNAPVVASGASSPSTVSISDTQLNFIANQEIKLLKQGDRLVYQVDDGVLVVLVLSVSKREDMAAYRAAIARLTQGL
jgi:hypothetical protein